jgi:hypothetical protein
MAEPESPKKDAGKTEDWANLESESESEGEEGPRSQGGEKDETKDSAGYRVNRPGPPYRGGRGGGRGRPYNNEGGPRPPYKEKRPMENQPKQEMLNLITKSQEPLTIVLFNVDYNARPEDVLSVYPGIKIDKCEWAKNGVFILELPTKEDATKLAEAGSKYINKRPFFMKLGNPNKTARDDQWHQVQKPHQYGGGGRGGEDKPRKYNQNYSRKDQHFENESRPFEKPQYKKNYDQPQGGGFDKPKYEKAGGYNKPAYGGGDFKRPFTERRPEEVVLDPDNKFFAGTNKVDSELHIPKFTRSAQHLETENKSESAKLQKSNPFGDAKPRDEKIYVKPDEVKITSTQSHEEIRESKFKNSSKNKEESKEIVDLNSPPPGISSSPTKKDVAKESEEVPVKKPDFASGPKKFIGKGNKNTQQSQEKPVEKKVVTQSQQPPKQETKTATRKMSAKANLFGALEDDDNESDN